MRNRKCTNPAPANEGKTCFDQQLGSEMESEACNIEQCEGKATGSPILFRKARSCSGKLNGCASPDSA